MHCRRSWLYAVSFLALGFAAASPAASAQASSAASRGADLSVFGGLQIANPDYGPSHMNKGGTVGVDFTKFLRFPVQPALELRANFNNGPYASERSYVFGLRAMALFGRYEPYADFLVGPGDIHFPQNAGYIGDNSTVYNYGGGVDVGVTRNFSLKLDLQAQHWNTGELRYQPVLGTVGVTYHIPFRPHISQDTLIH